MTRILNIPSATSLTFDVEIEVCRGTDWNSNQIGVVRKGTVHVEIAGATEEDLARAVWDIVEATVTTTAKDGPLAMIDYAPDVNSVSGPEDWQANTLLWPRLLSKQQEDFRPGRQAWQSVLQRPSVLPLAA